MNFEKMAAEEAFEKRGDMCDPGGSPEIFFVCRVNRFLRRGDQSRATA